MKIKYTLISTFLIVSAFAHGAWQEKVDVGGHFRLRAESSQKPNFTTTTNQTLLRFRPHMKFKGGESWSVFFQPQFVKTLGATQLNPATAATNANQTTSGTTYDTGPVIHQAYLNYSFSESLDIMLGRQVLAYGDDLVVGHLDWNNVGRSFDALRLRYGAEDYWIDLFGSHIVDTLTNPNKRVFYGLYGHFSIAEFLKTLELYVFMDKNRTTGTLVENYTAGVRAVSKISSLDYRLEATKQFGTQFVSDSNALQGDLEVGYSLGDIRIAGEGFFAGSEYRQLFPTAHKWLGIVDVLGRRNVVGFAGHASWKATENFKAKASYHMFSRKDNTVSAFRLNGASALGSGSANTSKNIGSEIDLTLQYNLGDGLALTGGAGFFLSGDYLAQLGDFDPTFFFLQMVAKM